MNLLIPLFSPATGTWGGLTRVIAVAEAARPAGHKVAFCASGPLEASLRSRGYRVYAMPHTTLFGLPAPLSRLLERRSQRVTLPVKPGRAVGSIWMVLLLSGLARPGYLRRLVEAERRAAKDFRAEILFTDLDPGAFLLATVTGLPLASNYASIVTTGRGGLPWQIMRRAIGGALKAYGLNPCDPEELCFSAQILKIIPSIPELDDTDPARPDVRYVGHLLGDIQANTDFMPAPGKRYVFVYVGTGSLSLDRLKDVLPQVFPADGMYECLVGAQSITAAERLGGVEFRPYVPAEAVLAHADWTICHGGQNTIIQSLRAGVPLLIFPGPIFERRFNAQKVQQAGAGRMGELPDFKVDWLRAALQARSDYAPRAAALGEKIRAYGGARAAVEALAQWASR
jgi:UDP:flavonoid glycosyltransferase YjiC (YdhE family)